MWCLLGRDDGSFRILLACLNRIRAGIGLGQAMHAKQAGNDGQGRFRVYENGTI
jgi:hypothetical protein